VLADIADLSYTFLMKSVVAYTVAGLLFAGAPAGAQSWNNKAPWGPGQHRRGSGGPLRDHPFKIFDNVYYVGLHNVSSYLVTTSAGLVLIDATNPETADAVLDAIRKAGFNPSDIKYIIVTHGHIDHLGGAARIQRVSSAPIGMSAEDWKFAGEVPGPHDFFLKDNGSLTLGGTTFKFYVTPGHTPGSTSVEFQVRDRGRSYRALEPGGLGIAFGPEWTPVFLMSIERLKQLGPWDVVFGNHPFLMPKDLEYDIENALPTRGDGPHPAVVGPAKINEWFDAILRVVREKQASERTN
jgi:metallo-beta-lactamase class B